MHRDMQRLGGGDDFAGHFDVGAAGGGIAEGMIVHQDDGAGAMLQRPLDDFAG